MNQLCFLSALLFILLGNVFARLDDRLARDLSALRHDLAAESDENNSFLATRAKPFYRMQMGDIDRPCEGVKAGLAAWVVNQKKAAGVKATDALVYPQKPFSAATVRIFTAFAKQCTMSTRFDILVEYPWVTRDLFDFIVATLPETRDLPCDGGLCSNTVKMVVDQSKNSDVKDNAPFFLYDLASNLPGLQKYLQASDVKMRADVVRRLSNAASRVLPGGLKLSPAKYKECIDQINAYGENTAAETYTSRDKGGLAEQLVKDCNRDSYTGRRAEYINKWLDEFTAVAAAEKHAKGAAALASFQWALRDAFLKTQLLLTQNAKKTSCNIPEWAEAAQRLKGPGSAYVKTFLIAALYARGAGVAPYSALALLGTDPAGILAELSGNSILKPWLINQIFHDIIVEQRFSIATKVRDISSILGQAMGALVLSISSSDWLNLAVQMKFHSAAHDLGVATGCLVNAIGDKGDVAKQYIKGGGMIVKIFTKALGKIPAIGSSVQEKLDGMIDKQVAKEDEAVDDWVARYQSGVATLLDLTFHAAAKGKTRGEFHDIAVQFQVYYQEGYEKALKAKIGIPDSTIASALSIVDGATSFAVGKLAKGPNANVKMNTAEQDRMAQRINKEAQENANNNAMRHGGATFESEKKRLAEKYHFDGNLA